MADILMALELLSRAPSKSAVEAALYTAFGCSGSCSTADLGMLLLGLAGNELTQLCFALNTLVAKASDPTFSVSDLSASVPASLDPHIKDLIHSLFEARRNEALTGKKAEPQQPRGTPLTKQEELLEVHRAFLMLGKSDPQHLFFIHQISCPQVPESDRLPQLSAMLEDAPAAISRAANEDELSSMIKQGNSPLATLVELREVQQVVAQMLPDQILSLTKGLVPPGTFESQVEYMLRSQEIVQSWTPEVIRQYHSLISETAPAQQRQKLLELEPLIPWEIVHLIVELINLPLPSFLNFVDWFTQLSNRSVGYLVNLLQLDTISLLSIRNSLMPIEHTFSSPMPKPVEQQQQPQHNPAPPPILESSAQPFPLDTSSGSIPTWGGQQLAGSGGNLLSPFSPLDSLDRDFGQMQDDAMQPVDEPFPGSSSISGLGAMPPQIPAEPPSPSLLSPSFGYDSGSLGSLPPSRRGGPLQASTGPPNSPPSIIPKERRASRAKSSAAPYSTIRPTTPPPSSSLVQLPVAPPSVSPDIAAGEGLQLKVVRQPPAKTVYQRILKPFPSLMLLGNEAALRGQNLFIEATLVRSDSDIELGSCLEGTKVVRVATGVFATFKKLKILATSQQQGSLFRLRFLLKRYVGNEFHFVPGAVAVSDALEVFSHTLYLTDKPTAGATPLPSVSEVLPCDGPPGTRVVVLGANFLHSPRLRVSFGTVVLVPTFHEAGTLICSVPAPEGTITPGTQVPVRVSNDGTTFCESTATFTYYLAS